METQRRFLSAALLLCVSVCAAQQLPNRNVGDVAVKPAANGTVTGHVYLDDAKSPGRKAMVSLEPAAAFVADEQPKRGADRDAGPIALGVEAEFDGSFRFTHVPAGSYFIVANYPGYISPYLALSIAESRSGYGHPAPLGLAQRAAKERVLSALPKVNVQSDLPVSADVILERGAAVSGTVTYDDGGPAAGLNMEILARMKREGKESWEQIRFSRHGGSGFLPPRTDDRGSYRISGLPAGKYLIEVSVEFSDTKSYDSPSGGGAFGSNAHRAFLPIYSGSTPRKKDAEAFSLQQREERTGEDIIIPMSKLHTIKGNIVSARDGHVVNGGQVNLLNADDHTFVASQNLTEDDPSFTFSLIFEGNYILSSTVSSDVDYVPNPQIQNAVIPQYNAKIRHLYGRAAMPLHVEGDMDGVTIRVPEPTAKEAQMYADDLRRQEEEESKSAARQ